MNRTEVITLLKKFFDPNIKQTLSKQQLEKVIIDFQELHGLTPDGEVGPVTERYLQGFGSTGFRFCATPDRVSGGQICRWDKSFWDGKKFTVDNPSPVLIKYFVTGSLPGLTSSEQTTAFHTAFQYWTDVCALVAESTSNQSEAHILIQVGTIDASGSTLAWSELPCGKDRMLQQMYDSGEPWVNSENPPNGKIDITRVACHEIGHAIGIDHIEEGNLLAPFYNPAIRKPQAGDIKQAQLRYGPPITVTTPTPQPPADGEQIIISIGSATYKGKVAKVA